MLLDINVNNAEKEQRGLEDLESFWKEKEGRRSKPKFVGFDVEFSHRK